MSRLQVALGLVQLERIEELVARKREILAWYQRELAGVPGGNIAGRGSCFRGAFKLHPLMTTPPKRS